MWIKVLIWEITCIAISPSKHRKFRCPAKGRGPPGPLNLEVMILSNERDLNHREECSPRGNRNVSRGETQALKNLNQNKKIVCFLLIKVMHLSYKIMQIISKRVTDSYIMKVYIGN
jgi:hypothetical protein